MPLHDALRQRMQPVAQAITSQRFFIYAVLSTLAVIAVIANACRNYSNFYSVSIYLGKSGRSVVFLANFCCLLALLCGKVMQRIFFGPLQAREVERLYDQTWMFVTESLLAFTIFRDEFDIPFGVMFGFLLFVKCFHWLMSDRIESMDQLPYPGPPTWFHVRMNTLFLILWMVDFVSFSLAIDTTLDSGVGGMVLFANEYAILMASALNSMAKYVVNLIEFRRARANGGENAPPWEDKSMYLFYIELVTDFLKLVTYLTFFVIIVIYYGLPLNMIRDVYVTARSFITRFRALLRYRTATRDMDRRYPNATEEELAAMSDRTCIICRDEMVTQQARRPNDSQATPNTTPKKLPCGHMFHFNCLRSWLERQQSCPTCRRTVLEANAAPRPGQQFNGRRPAGPQPGAPLNPFGAFGGLQGVAQAPQQPVQQQGWLGRLLNAAVPPPLAPGQGGNAFVPVNPGQPLAMGWAQFPQNPPPYGPFMNPYQPPLQQLQHPPPFPGFYGPGGAWQPWGIDPQILGEQQQQHQQHHQQQQPQTHYAPTDTSNSPAAPSDPQASAPAPAASNPPPADAPSTPWTEGQRARDAAASAALRRFNSGMSSSGSGPAPSPASPSPSTPGTRSGPTSNGVNGSSSSPVAPSTSTDGAPLIPRFIPLMDFSTISRSLSINSPLPHQPLTGFAAGASMPAAQGYTVPMQQNGVHSRHFQQTNSIPLAQTRPVPPFFESSTQTQTSTSTSQTSLWSQMPPVVTDEQLTRMEQLTREAIDERLRVLGRVDEVVNMCIDELTRMRSVLPPVESASIASTSGTMNGVVPGINGTSVDTAGTNEAPAASDSSEKARGKQKANEPILTVDPNNS